MTRLDIAHSRLLHQHIAGTKFARPDEVVRWMGAMQAQDYQQALWAVGLRMRAPTLASVEAALASGTIILTWPLRGTLHFVAAENVRWMLELLAPRRVAADQTRRHQLELDERTLERCARLFRNALAGGQRLTRAALMRLLEDVQINPTGQRGYHILWYLAQTGLICLGPRQGRSRPLCCWTTGRRSHGGSREKRRWPNSLDAISPAMVQRRSPTSPPGRD